MSFNLILRSQSDWSLFIGMWQKRREELNIRLRFENEEMTLQIQLAVHQVRIRESTSKSASNSNPNAHLNCICFVCVYTHQKITNYLSLTLSLSDGKSGRLHQIQTRVHT